MEAEPARGEGLATAVQLVDRYPQQADGPQQASAWSLVSRDLRRSARAAPERMSGAGVELSMETRTIVRPLPTWAGAWTVIALAAGLWGCAGTARPNDSSVTPSADLAPAEAEVPDASSETDPPLTVGADSGRHQADSATAHDGSGERPHGRHGEHAGHRNGSHAGDPSDSHGGHGSNGAVHGGHGSQGASHDTPVTPVTETTIDADGRVTIARPEWPLVSAKAREQIVAVERAVVYLDTPAKARAAGFRPALGMIPTMGVHWVNMTRMGEGVNLLAPDHLLFSPVNGEQRLVGVAYAFMGGIGDAPDLFDGRHDVWHEHPELALPGEALVMLHVWFVPSPNGPFAGHNPLLAYWAAGVQPPPTSAFHAAPSAARARRLALALAEAVEPMAFARLIPAGSALSTSIERRRDAIRAVIPRLRHARLAGDQAIWNREADAAVAEWETIRGMYLDAIPMEHARDRLAAFYREMEAVGH